MAAKKQHTVIKIPRRKIKSLINDNIKSAEAIKLRYVNDKQKGISRIQKNNGFAYAIGDTLVEDPSVLDRIKKLAIPPAWEHVWICLSADGHIQATGIDTNGRKQYRYHALWNALRSETKFSHLYDFGMALPQLRKQLDTDLSLQGMPLQKVLAAIVSIMEYTGVRVGNNAYEKLYGSFGITTLKNRHVNIKGNVLRFSFIGKKGIAQNISLKSRKLAKIVMQCRDIPGKELFQYYDEAGVRKPIDSGMVNEYIQNICGKHFSAKDFRTWVGTLCALDAFMQAGCSDNAGDCKGKVTEVLDTVAKRLGNTRTVCRKYYVHPTLINSYSDRSIKKYFEKLPKYNGNDFLEPQEQMLLDILGKPDSIIIAA